MRPEVERGRGRGRRAGGPAFGRGRKSPRAGAPPARPLLAAAPGGRPRHKPMQDPAASLSPHQDAHGLPLRPPAAVIAAGGRRAEQVVARHRDACPARWWRGREWVVGAGPSARRGGGRRRVQEKRSDPRPRRATRCGAAAGLAPAPGRAFCVSAADGLAARAAGAAGGGRPAASARGGGRGSTCRASARRSPPPWSRRDVVRRVWRGGRRPPRPQSPAPRRRARSQPSHTPHAPTPPPARPTTHPLPPMPLKSAGAKTSAPSSPDGGASGDAALAAARAELNDAEKKRVGLVDELRVVEKQVRERRGRELGLPQRAPIKRARRGPLACHATCQRRQRQRTRVQAARAQCRPSPRPLFSDLRPRDALPGQRQPCGHRAAW